MNKTKIIIILIALAAVYFFFIRQKPIKNKAGADGIPDEEGWYYFRYLGGSALRSGSNGTPIPCGAPGDGTNASGFVTNFFATLEIGKMEGGEFVAKETGNCITNVCRIVPGDVITEVEILQGASSTNVPLQDGNFEVLQLGTDTCTPSGVIGWPKNGIVVDLLLAAQGGSAPIYSTNGPVLGRFKIQQ